MLHAAAAFRRPWLDADGMCHRAARNGAGARARARGHRAQEHTQAGGPSSWTAETRIGWTQRIICEIIEYCRKRMRTHMHTNTQALAQARTHTRPRACTHPRTHFPLSHTRTHARAHACAARELEESARTASRGFLNTSSSSSLKLFGLKYGCMSHQHWYLRRAKACGWAHRRRRARASALACVRAIRVCVRACACMHAICMSMRACACTRASVRACVWLGGDRSGLRATRTGA